MLQGMEPGAMGQWGPSETHLHSSPHTVRVLWGTRKQSQVTVQQATHEQMELLGAQNGTAWAPRSLLGGFKSDDLSED